MTFFSELVYASSLPDVSSEWYTPYEIIAAARATLGGRICLDPASNAHANRVVGAQRFYTKEDDGLNQPWDADTLWCNPPYGTINGRSKQGIWARHLVGCYRRGEVREAVLLVTAAHDMKWFRVLRTYPICLIDHKVHFYGPDDEDKQHPQGAAVVYFGPHEMRFWQYFHTFGAVMKLMVPEPVEDAPLTLWEEVSRDDEEG